MPHTNQTAEAIREMALFFLPHCSDKSTLLELASMAQDDYQWRYAHALFSRIRDKTLHAIASKDKRLGSQYSFEEICAKTLFNKASGVTQPEFPYPFDDDSAFWVVPLAIQFARKLGIEDPCSISSLLRPKSQIQP